MRFEDLEIVKQFIHKDKDKIIAWVKVMYDQKSDLNKIHDLEERRQQACKKAGLKYTDPDVQTIINLNHDDVNELVFRYHVHHSSLKYQSLCTDQQLFWRIQQRINSSIDEEDDVETILKKRSELSDLSRQLLIRIDGLYSEIFATKDVIEHAERHIREMLTPEKRLKMNGGISSNVP